MSFKTHFVVVEFFIQELRILVRIVLGEFSILFWEFKILFTSNRKTVDIWKRWIIGARD